MFLRPAAAAALLPALMATAGCASLTESTQQNVLVQTVLEHREIAGVGCVLYNDVGKWFVTTPARELIPTRKGIVIKPWNSKPNPLSRSSFVFSPYEGPTPPGKVPTTGVPGVRPSPVSVEAWVSSWAWAVLATNGRASSARSRARAAREQEPMCLLMFTTTSRS